MALGVSVQPDRLKQILRDAGYRAGRCDAAARGVRMGYAAPRRSPFQPPSAVAPPAQSPSSDQANRLQISRNGSNNGGGGIRTLVGAKRPETVFETAAFNRSATPPRGTLQG